MFLLITSPIFSITYGKKPVALLPPSSIYQLLHHFCFGSGVFPDWDCLVSFTTEADSRGGGAAGVFCCLSMST